MEKKIPLWVFRLTLFVGALFTVAFGWAVRSTLYGSDESGSFGRAAVAIAAFPSKAKMVIDDVWVDTMDNDAPIRVPSMYTDLSTFEPVPSKGGINVAGLMMRSGMMLAESVPGWRILVGAFTIDGELTNAAIAVSPALEIAHIWPLSEETIGVRVPRPPHRKFIHGFDILRDGSVIVAFDNGMSLQRFDACGKRLWATAGTFNHTVTLTDDEAFVWTLLGEDVARVATGTGDITQRFSMDDIIAANDDIDILGIRQRNNNDLGGNSRNTSEAWLSDRFHLNDVDPLPEALAEHFSGFSAGDLLISARNLNLIFVVDPSSLRVKWWRTGATRRQHDPDWGTEGLITVYDNRMSRDYSRILAIAPGSLASHTLFDGRDNGFYSRIRGKHQFIDFGNLLVTSSQQGRVFELNERGEMVLEFINRRPGPEPANYAVSDAIWLPGEQFSFLEDLTCAN